MAPSLLTAAAWRDGCARARTACSGHTPVSVQGADLFCQAAHFGCRLSLGAVQDLAYELDGDRTAADLGRGGALRGGQGPAGPFDVADLDAGPGHVEVVVGAPFGDEVAEGGGVDAVVDGEGGGALAAVDEGGGAARTG